ncbi:MAG: hypothetical protein J6M60_06780 [Clostridia bacterium]|nr:hypothetical protein [Clostridia bacterium]
MVKKILVLFLIVLAISSITMQIKVQATSFDSVITDANKFLDDGKGDNDKDPENLLVGQKAAKEFSSMVYNTLLTIGTIIAVIVGVILGVKIVTSGVEEKAQVKELLVPYFVGVVILFGAFGIWKLVVEILQ